MFPLCMTITPYNLCVIPQVVAEEYNQLKDLKQVRRHLRHFF